MKWDVCTEPRGYWRSDNPRPSHTVHPAAIWQQIHKYLLPYNQTREQLQSPGRETPELILNTAFSKSHVAGLKGLFKPLWFKKMTIKIPLLFISSLCSGLLKFGCKCSGTHLKTLLCFSGSPSSDLPVNANSNSQIQFYSVPTTFPPIRPIIVVSPSSLTNP